MSSPSTSPDPKKMRGNRPKNKRKGPKPKADQPSRNNQQLRYWPNETPRPSTSRDPTPTDKYECDLGPQGHLLSKSNAEELSKNRQESPTSGENASIKKCACETKHTPLSDATQKKDAAAREDGKEDTPLSDATQKKDAAAREDGKEEVKDSFRWGPYIPKVSSS